MAPIRKIYWLWVGLGTAVSFHGLITGSGPAGLLLYWQLAALGAVFPVTHILVAVPLVVAPLVLLGVDADRRRSSSAPVSEAASGKLWGKRFLVSSLILTVVAALCLWRTTLLPSPDALTQRLVLDEIAPAGQVAEHRSVLVGTPQRAFSLRYDEVLTSRFHSSKYRHYFVPVTRSDWTPGQPVRFLADTRSERYTSERGLLLRGQLPGYVRQALSKKGLLLAEDVMVLSADRDFGRTPWYLAAACSGIGAFIGLTFGLLLPWARGKSEAEREALAPRAAGYFLFAFGGFLILLSLVFAARKVVHIVGAASAEGVITGTQTSHSPVGKYSFYVDYSTPEGHFKRFAHTWTPFSKAVGDKVTVLYDPSAPRDPEILAFDDSWAAYAIIFVPGAAIVALGMILFRPRPTAQI